MMIDADLKTAQEKWVDRRVVAEHIGFGYQTTRRMVMKAASRSAEEWKGDVRAVSAIGS
jgi:hypothetical protein